MVKKIINWTANGFFRSLGKFLFFFLITCLFVILLGNGSVKITDLLGIETVYADTNASYSSIKFEVEQCTYKSAGPDRIEFDTCVWDNRTTLGDNGRISFGSRNGHLRKIQLQVYGGSNVFPSGSYRFVSTIAQDPKYAYELFDQGIYYIRIYGNTSSSSSGASSGIETISSQSCVLNNITNSNYSYQISCVFNTSKDLKYLNFSMEILNNYNVPINTNAIQWNSLDVFTYNENPTGAINNQTTIIQNEFQNLDNTLTDSDVDSDSNDMVDFLTGFEFDNDATFSNLITLPIDFITNVFLQTTTADLCVTFRGQNICLPNGKILWERTHTCNQEVTLCDNNVSLTAFQTLFSILVGGYLSFKLLRGLVRSFDDIVDPTIDSVEMPDVGGYKPLHNNNVNRSTVYRRVITGRRSL